MNTPIKILHIDPDFRITYFIKHPGSVIRSLVPLNEAIQLIKTQEFNLILSEPHNKAIMKPEAKNLLMENKNRILIVDDNPILREGLKSVLSHYPAFEIAGEAGDGLEAIESVDKSHPDLVLMDLSMPRMDGLAATREIKKKWPATKILVFTVHKTPEYLTAILEAGADRYLIKDSSQTELIQSIQDIMDGKQGFNTSIVGEAAH